MGKDYTANELAGGFLSFIADTVMNDETFSDFIEDDMRQNLLDAQRALNEGKQQLVTDKYSRIIIDSTYPDEGEEHRIIIY